MPLYLSLHSNSSKFTPMFGLFYDCPEYEERKASPFSPPSLLASEIRALIPKHLFQKSCYLSTYYVLRDVLVVLLLLHASFYIDLCVELLVTSEVLGRSLGYFVRCLLWTSYWWWQSLTLAAWWCLGHEAGHESLYVNKSANHIVGFCLHTTLLSPFFAFRASHRGHHQATNSIERDEIYVPRTRQELGLPRLTNDQDMSVAEMFEDTPIFTLGKLLVMQLLGWHLYLFRNAEGSTRYPAGTNHFNPSSPLFRPRDRRAIAMSNIALVAMFIAYTMLATSVGKFNFIRIFFIPYVLLNHWIVMITYLQHSDPTVPKYRAGAWTWVRGAIATIDRPFLGAVGRVLLHNVSHDHVAHHLFSDIPFYNLPEVTILLRHHLQDQYIYDSTNVFRALWRSFSQCRFVEDDGDIVFFKNGAGKTHRIYAAE